MLSLESLNSARGRRFHHRHHGRRHHNRAEGRALSPAMKLLAHKLTGAVVAGTVGFVDTYSGMPAFGADAAGKGGVGLDTLATAVVNIGAIGFAIWKGRVVGQGTYLEPIASGLGDGLLFGWVTKQAQVYGASKKAGADAMVAGLDYSGATNQLTDHNVPYEAHAAPEVVYDPLHGMR